MNIQSKYFFIAVVAVGSIGIWLPIIIELAVDKTVTFHSIPPNLTTYFVTILVAGCIDYFLSKLDAGSGAGLKSVFLNVIMLLLGCVFLVGLAVWLNVAKYDVLALTCGFVGMAISYRIWWIANIDNPNFSTGTASLGGDAEKPLANGK